MGTSGRSGGPNPRTPLVPSWLEEPPSHIPSDEPLPEPNPADQPLPLPALPPPPPPDRFRIARTHFTQFAASGGKDRRSLKRSARDYVRSGAGGSRNATLRMGASRNAARGVLQLFREFQRDGVNATLLRLDLGALVGRPIPEVLSGLTHILGVDGGSIDEGIALDAWIETVAELDTTFTISDSTGLSADQMKNVFQAFVAHSIEGKLMQDVGSQGLNVAVDLAAIEAFEKQLKDYIRRSVRDSFTGNLSNLESLTNRQIHDVVDRAYQDAWELLVVWGDASE